MECLDKKITKIENVFNIGFYMNFNTTTENIKSYYHHSRKYYKLFHSKEGCMHFKLYSNEKKKIDIYGQSSIINKYIADKKGSKILEIGCGQGADIKYLSKRNKNVEFYGLDLCLPKEIKNKNKIMVRGDYHDLSLFESNSFDLIYAIETLCYSEEKTKVFKEINRVLKPNGLFIIFDGYFNKEGIELSEKEKIAVKLTDSGMAISKFEGINSFEIKRKGFELIERKDFTKDLLPSWKKYERFSNIFIKFKLIRYLGLKIISKEALGNVITGNLGYVLFENEFYVYMIHVYEKIK